MLLCELSISLSCLVSCQTTIIIVTLYVHVFLESADSVTWLKGRVEAARDKTKDLLKAVKGTMETLNAIPNGTV